MFFPERIKSIGANDKVLEIGPGATPYFRSDIFLELQYDIEEERIAQSGHVGILDTEKPIVYYDGGKFPFNNNEFDYVICSHVIEHVTDLDVFLSELQRVGKKGYLEFPTVYYDYIYNFPEHNLLILEKNGVLNWMTKEESGLDKFADIQKFFYKTCELGYYETINNFKKYFFQGFEWSINIKSKHVDQIELITYHEDSINLIQNQIKKFSKQDEQIYESISFKDFLRYKFKKLIK
ncbi:MAG: methyltransferase domain-containing protein [Flaviramulus sp.]|nr:methyltransferase domain-containing protein [Flaviramulus sp.]NNC50948.1 methyltransferase domain-containing protein [Flaviramulus sp.]